MHEPDGFDFPSLRVSFPGPFLQHDVVVDGWSVPLLHAQVHQGGKVTLMLDNRFMLDLDADHAEAVVPFVANAIAIALGYNAHPSDDDEDLARPSANPKPRRVTTVAGLTPGPD
jgi:hypothetical protein